MKRSIEEQQPTENQLVIYMSLIRRAIKQTSGMALEHIEYSPNYIGLFVYVTWRGDSMCFLFSFNQLRRCENNPGWIKRCLLQMAKRQHDKRTVNKLVHFQQRIRRKAAGES